MRNFEFISYIPTPNDQYGMLGIAKAKAYGKIELRFKHLKTKDGTSSFFCMSNYTMVDAMGEKKYLPCIMIDSRTEEEELQEVMREGVNRVLSQRSAQPNAAIPQQNANYYPNGYAQQAPIPPMPPSSMSEVAEQEQIPF